MIAASLTFASRSLADCAGPALKFDVSGNSKTTTKTVIRLTELKGDCAPDGGVDVESVKQKLLNSHLFSKVEVSKTDEEGATVVHIVVKDKWTIIPVPVLYTSGDTSGGGLMIVETNLLGRKKMLVGGVAFSNRGNNYDGIYIDDALFGSKFVLIVRPMFTQRVIYKYDDADKVYGYNDDFSMVFGILGYKITEHIAPGVGLVYKYRHLTKLDDYAPPPQEGHTNGAMVNLRVNYIDFEDYYDKGFTSTITYQNTIRSFGADQDFGQLQVSMDYTHPVWKILSRSLIDGSWIMGEHVTYTVFPRLGSEPGNRGIPSAGLWVANYLQASQAFEEVLFRHKYGTLTVAQFMDCVFTAEDAPIRSYPQPGLGLRVYLKQVAIPAVGVDTAYNIRTNEFHFSAYVGKAF